MGRKPTAPKRAEVMAFILAFYREHDRIPFTREVSAHFKVSQTTAIKLMGELVQQGKIQKDGRYHRFPRK